MTDTLAVAIAVQDLELKNADGSNKFTSTGTLPTHGDGGPENLTNMDDRLDDQGHHSGSSNFTTDEKRHTLQFGADQTGTSSNNNSESVKKSRPPLLKQQVRLEGRPTILKKLASAMPKVELHVHLEGTLDPELVFALAQRNDIDLTPHFKDEDDLRSRYESFTDLNSFLDVYYRCASVLCTEQDFYELTMAYFAKAKQNNIVYAEMFFDPQHHKEQRGLSFETCANGIISAMNDAHSRYGIQSKLIPCFLRHLPEASAKATWIEIFKYMKSHPASKSKIVGVGLDSSEKKNPPRKFHGVFWMIRHASKGVVGDMHVVAHAGEEGPARYITEALNLLHAERIDHGVQCVKDAKLVQRLREENIPLTVCPLSNTRLKVFGHMKDHNLKRMLDLGLNVSTIFIPMIRRILGASMIIILPSSMPLTWMNLMC
mmetsp:Transcript_14188/g.24229  ORF Transcript_14188/g.24229 Transcript_14188/m.24229 type:complete len:429 (+) Transcript_14188:140-1426(+)